MGKAVGSKGLGLEGLEWGQCSDHSPHFLQGVTVPRAGQKPVILRVGAACARQA